MKNYVEVLESFKISDFSKTTIIYDKAKFHIDDYHESKELVIEYFKELFKWLNDNKLLSAEGIELIKTGIDSEISLHSGLLTTEGNNFIKDQYGRIVQYTMAPKKMHAALDDYYDDFKRNFHK